MNELAGPAEAIVRNMRYDDRLSLLLCMIVMKTMKTLGNRCLFPFFIKSYEKTERDTNRR